jgi:hypothetical protein
LRGRVRRTAGQVAWEGHAGDLLVVPEARVTLQAAEDSAVLLTVSKTPGSSSLTRDRPRTDQEVLHAPTELRSRSARRKESAIWRFPKDGSAR